MRSPAPDSPPDEEAVRAAGGVVVRRAGAGLELVVVHRPRYDDWTLPKGKCEPGEGWEDCALREVEEETGLRCSLLREAGSTGYRDDAGRRKQVRWWLMRPEAGRLQGLTEADVARWVTPAEAESRLTYERDRALLQKLLRETALWVVRHAAAGHRAWAERDRERPLDAEGRAQAEQLAASLRREPIDRLASSPYLRCVQTLLPLGAAVGRPVEQVPELGEGHGLQGIEPLLISGGSSVACTHGDVLDELLGRLRAEGLAPAGARAAKASAWELRCRAGLILEARYHPPPGESR